MHTPSKPFNEIKPVIAGALDTVNSMTEEQLRYAMWCALVLLFSSPRCNASEILTSEISHDPSMLEAQLILAEAGCSRTKSWGVSMIKKKLDAKRINNHD